MGSSRPSYAKRALDRIRFIYTIDFEAITITRERKNLEIVRDRLSDSDRDVLLILSSFVDESTGLCWPSVNRIAYMLDRDERRIRESLSRLRAAKLIDVLSAVNKKGEPIGGTSRDDITGSPKGKSTRYRLTLEDAPTKGDVYRWLAERREQERARKQIQRARAVPAAGDRDSTNSKDIDRTDERRSDRHYP